MIYDDELRATVCSPLNIQLAESDPSWTQSTLPVHAFCLLGFSCCLLRTCSPNSASKYATTPCSSAMWMRLLLHGPKGVKNNPPTDAAAHHQKTWDSIRVSSIADTLFADSSDPMHGARFLAACPAGYITGTMMDNATMRTSMGLRLGLPLCQSHTCQ